LPPETRRPPSTSKGGEKNIFCASLHIAVNVLEYETEPPFVIDPNDPPPRKTPINRFGVREQGRVAAILRHLKWVAKRKNTERWWEPGPGAI
jgi:hypothetical protein